MEHTEGLETFVTIVRAGALAVAARNTGISRAALTRRLDALEARLGVRLLHRTTRALTLTAAGDELLRRAAPLVDAAREATLAVQAAADEPRGPLRVAAPPSVPGVDLSPLFISFAVRYPLVELSVEQASRYVDLRAEQIDVALRGGDVGDETLLARRLMHSVHVAVASPGYLDRAGVPATAGDLTRHDLLLSCADGCTPEHRWRLNDGALLPVRGRLASNDLHLRRSAALQGLGICRLPIGFVERELRTGALVEVLPDALRLKSSLHLVWVEREFVQRKVMAFVEHATAWYQQAAAHSLLNEG